MRDMKAFGGQFRVTDAQYAGLTDIRSRQIVGNLTSLRKVARLAQENEGQLYKKQPAEQVSTEALDNMHFYAKTELVTSALSLLLRNLACLSVAIQSDDKRKYADAATTAMSGLQKLLDKDSEDLEVDQRIKADINKLLKDSLAGVKKLFYGIMSERPAEFAAISSPGDRYRVFAELADVVDRDATLAQRHIIKVMNKKHEAQIAE